MIGNYLKLRFAAHPNTSVKHGEPDFNFVSRAPTYAEFQEIESRMQTATLCKKTAFSKHIGLTVPKLKKLLTPECFEDVCENEARRSWWFPQPCLAACGFILPAFCRIGVCG
jgi:hypothetical protein